METIRLGLDVALYPARQEALMKSERQTILGCSDFPKPGIVHEMPEWNRSASLAR